MLMLRIKTLVADQRVLVNMDPPNDLCTYFGEMAYETIRMLYKIWAGEGDPREYYPIVQLHCNTKNNSYYGSKIGSYYFMEDDIQKSPFEVHFQRTNFVNTFSKDISWGTNNFWSHHCSQRGYANLVHSEEVGQRHDVIEILESDSEEEGLDFSQDIGSSGTLQKDVTEPHDVLGLMKKTSSNVEEKQIEEPQYQSGDDFSKVNVGTTSLLQGTIEEEENVDESYQSHDDLRQKDVDIGSVPETILARTLNFEETNEQDTILPKNYISSSQTTLRSFSTLQSPSRSGTLAMSETPVGIKNFAFKCSIISVFRFLQFMPELLKHLEKTCLDKYKSFKDDIRNDMSQLAKSSSSIRCISGFLLCGNALNKVFKNKSKQTRYICIDWFEKAFFEKATKFEKVTGNYCSHDFLRAVMNVFTEECESCQSPFLDDLLRNEEQVQYHCITCKKNWNSQIAKESSDWCYNIVVQKHSAYSDCAMRSHMRHKNEISDQNGAIIHLSDLIHLDLCDFKRPLDSFKCYDDKNPPSNICKSVVYKNTAINHESKYIMIHLIRSFLHGSDDSSSSTMAALKVQTGVYVPRDLLLYTNCEGTETVTYNFVAAICHEGEKADEGHNVVLSVHNGKCIRISDKITTQLETAEFQKQLNFNSTLLLYSKDHSALSERCTDFAEYAYNDEINDYAKTLFQGLYSCLEKAVSPPIAIGPITRGSKRKLAKLTTSTTNDMKEAPKKKVKLNLRMTKHRSTESERITSAHQTISTTSSVPKDLISTDVSLKKSETTSMTVGNVENEKQKSS